MKPWVSLAAPAAVFLLLPLFFMACPAAAGWGGSGSFDVLPHVALLIAIFLGAFFNQSRVSFIALLLMVITYLANHHFFVKSDEPAGVTVLFLSGIYVPPLAVLLYHMNERGILNPHGYRRIGLVASALFVILVMPLSDSLCAGVATVRFAAFSPVADWLPISKVGAVISAVAMACFFIPNKHENPVLGWNLCLSMGFVFATLNFRSSLWGGEFQQTAFVLLSLGAALSLVWTVLESSWRSAHIDELTELPGRRALTHHMARLTDGYAIAVADIDFFKKINDRYGHDTGDQVLRFIASFLRAIPVGRAYRFGGEEFVIVCEAANKDTLPEALDRFRASIQERKFWLRSRTRPRKKPEGAPPARSDPEPEGKGKTITVTISIGVAFHGTRWPTAQEVLEAADKALYRAKESGRNCVKQAK